MKSRKPKQKTNRKAKRNSQQQPSAAVEQVQFVPVPETNQEPANSVEIRGEAANRRSIAESQVESENSAAPVEVPDVTAEPEGAVAAQNETEGLASITETPVEAEKSAGLVELLDEVVDAANTVELRGEAEDLESILEIHVEVTSPASPAEMHGATRNPAPPPESYSASEIPVIAVAIPPVAEKTAPRSAADRRAHPRYAFTAAIEVVAPELSTRIETQVRDLSQQGCFVDTDRPLALGIATHVRITKGATPFEASARVVYNQTGKGMGLMFTTVELEHLKILDTWIAESRESSWRAANRRRSQRVLMRVPVRVSGQGADGANFEEETHTLSISPHGALLVLTPAVQRGQRFILANLQTKAALECVVAHLERPPGEPIQVGVEFSLPNPAFWRVAFPPKDWTPRHPDAKSR